MSKEFNLAAFITNFGRIITCQIEIEGGREAVGNNPSKISLLSHEQDFYAGIPAFKENIITEQEMFDSCMGLFEKYQGIVCTDEGYINSYNQFEASPPDISVIIESQLESALQYQHEQALRVDAIHAINAQAAQSIFVREERGDNENESDGEPFACAAAGTSYTTDSVSYMGAAATPPEDHFTSDDPHAP